MDSLIQYNQGVQLTSTDWTQPGTIQDSGHICAH